MVTTQKAASYKSAISRSTQHLLITIYLVCNDVVFIGLAFWGAYQMRFQTLFYPNPVDSQRLFILSTIAIPIWLLFFSFSRLYSTDVLFGGVEEYRRVFNAVTVGSIIIILLDFLFRNDEPISRGWLILSFVLSVFLLEISRFVFRRMVYFLRRHGHLLSPAINCGRWRRSSCLI